MSTQRLSKRLQLSLNHNLQRLNISKVLGTITFNVVNHVLDTNRMDLNDITPGSCYTCRYDNGLHLYIFSYVSMEHSDINVKFMHPKAPAKNFFWHDHEDVCWIPLNHDL